MKKCWLSHVLPMPPANDALEVLGWSARICCAGLMFQSLELASLWPELRDRHLLGWQGGEGNFTRRLQQIPRGFPVNLLVLLWRAAAGLCVALSTGGTATSWLLISLLLCQLYFNFRFRLILTNADHMNLVILAAVTIGMLPDVSPALRIVAIAFAAFQAMLAYAASGIEKLLAANWRNGSRLAQIFQDSSYRFPPLGRWLAARPGLARVVSWGVAVAEVLFPLSMFLPPAGFLAVIAAGLMFHVSIAVIMGLPGFFWAFAATYPALLFCHEYLTAAIHP